MKQMQERAAIAVALAPDWISYCVIALLAIMPFHAFFAIVLGHLFGHQAVFQAWKEILIATAMLAAGLLVVSKGKLPIRTTLVNCIALSIIILGLGVSILHPTGIKPFLYGVKITLLPLIAYLLVQAARHIPLAKLQKLILWPSYLVAIIAFLQEFLFPPRLLELIGYGAKTIKPIQLVDPAVSLIRAFSTLGGPNQLGAYLILPTILGLVLAWQRRSYEYAFGSALTALGVVLSFSRSAWLGLAAAIFMSVFLMGTKTLRRVLIGAAVVVSLGAIVIGPSLPARLQNTQLQYYLLHGRYNSQQDVEGSDVGRNQSQAAGIMRIRQNPLGLGLGSAGPASFQSTKPFITENWYYQAAVELGLLGLALYLAFFAMNFEFLARLPSSLGLALAASLVGICIAGFFLHVWTDSTLGLTFFVLLGLMQRERRI